MESLYYSPVFSGLPAGTIDALTKSFRERSYRRGEDILRQGEPGRHVYLLLEGKVEVYCESSAGERVTILFHQAPFVFGELEIWDEARYIASVRALERTKVKVIPRRDYLTLLHANHQVSINLVRLLSQLLLRTGRDRRVKFFGQVDHLLAHALLGLAELYGEPREYGIRLQKEVNKTELARQIGAARRSVIRSWDKLAKAGYVQLDGRYVVLTDVAALTRLARTQAHLD